MPPSKQDELIASGDRNRRVTRSVSKEVRQPARSSLTLRVTVKSHSLCQVPENSFGVRPELFMDSLPSCATAVSAVCRLPSLTSFNTAETAVAHDE